MPAKVVIAISNRRKSLVTTATLVRLFTCVTTHVDYQVPAFIKRLLAKQAAKARRRGFTAVHLNILFFQILTGLFV